MSVQIQDDQKLFRERIPRKQVIDIKIRSEQKKVKNCRGKKPNVSWEKVREEKDMCSCRVESS